MHTCSEVLRPDSGRFCRAARTAAAATLPLLLAALAACGSDETVIGDATSVNDVGNDGVGTIDAAADATAADATADDATADDDTATPDTATIDTATSDTGAADDSATVEDGATTDDASMTTDGTDDGAAANCTTDQCKIEGVCVDNDAAHPDDPCRRCVVIAKADDWTFVSGPCDDGDACTEKDACAADGTCQGAAKLCNDGNPCTNDSCKDGDCVTTPNTAPCADGDLCTQNDTCNGGSCKGVAYDAGGTNTCDDGDVCTSDGCDKQKGCTHTPLTASAGTPAPCDDGNACTSGDGCNGGACQGGAKIDCDDADICTVDACSPKTGCVHTSQAAKCKDDNPCTDAGCDKVKGCVFPFNTDPCDDGSVCTSGDTCASGICKGAALPSDDDNPCTDDSCDPKLGVAHVPNQLPCDDNDACTLNDICGKGGCQSGPAKPDCEDNNACTADTCDKVKGCLHSNTKDACDDGTACTKDDVCGDGTCAGAKIVCDDGNACTTDSCDAKTGCKHDVIVSNACRPQIVVTYPPRGATIKSEFPFITVTGTVKSGGGPITSFTLNNKSVKVDTDGAFKQEVVAAIGGNTLNFYAEDALGTKRKRVQAYLWSDSYLAPDAAKPKSGMVDPGVGYFLSKKAIDDGDHSLPPNDLATIFELFLQSYDFASVLPNPAYEGNGIVATVSNLKYGKAKVSLAPIQDALTLSATIPNITGDIQAKWSFLTLNGKLTITAINLSAKVKPVVVNHALATSVTDVVVTLDGFDIKLTGLGSLLNFLIAGLKGTFVNSLQDSIGNALKDQLGPVMASALSALAFSFDVGVPKLDGSGGKVDAKLLTDFSEVLIDTSGAIFRLRAGVYANKGNNVSNLGVPKRIGCGKGLQPLVIPKKSSLELAMADDMLNEFLYALWFGGLLEFPVGESLLKGIDLSQYGISDLKLTTKALLAPTASDCNDAGELLAHIGDFRVDASLSIFGQKMDVVVYATFVAGIQVSVDANKLTIQLTNVKSVQTDVEVQQEALIASESVIESLVADTLVKNLLTVLGGSALGGFELPVIDLSSTVKGLPPGTGIAIDPKTVTRIEGNTVIGGNLK